MGFHEVCEKQVEGSTCPVGCSARCAWGYKLRVTGQPQRDGSTGESQSEEHVGIPTAAGTKASS